MSTAALAQPGTTAHRAGFMTLALGSIGVVYGDIGTSPLYALKESLKAASAGGGLTPETTVGVVSLILWTLMIIVTLKYLALIMRADNNGEGGTLALMALAHKAMGNAPIIAVLGMLGASLFYGDAVLTPAVSVLSAVEGVKLVSPQFEPYVIGTALVILIALFAVQRLGTARVSAFFGPVMVLWFGLIAMAGIPHIAAQPQILAAINPIHGIAFLIGHGAAALLALGAVFLSVTGAEALYADMGHFGRKPIQVAWLGFVFPALVLNYLGQGALLLAEPDKLENPFYLLFPAWALVPMVLLATLATVIAAQAVITGAFSMTQQAIQLRLLPRVAIRPTSETERGQIYIPQINLMLLVGVIMLVLGFKTSDALASAYGIAVTGTMVITALLAFLVAWKVWNWSPVLAGLIVVPFLVIDVAFLVANSLKILEGGWLPLLFGALLMAVMLTWRRGSDLLSDKQAREALNLHDYLPVLAKASVARVDGTAVFLMARADEVPPALLHNIKHNRVLHCNNVVMTVTITDEPRVPIEERVVIEPLIDEFLRVTLRFGFMETPNVSRAMNLCRKKGWKFDVMKTSFFFSKRRIKMSARTQMPWWQDALFVRLAGHQSDASDHFHIPLERSVDLGRLVSI
jgi:KUP system potassium uptake protein